MRSPRLGTQRMFSATVLLVAAHAVFAMLQEPEHTVDNGFSSRPEIQSQAPPKAAQELPLLSHSAGDVTKTNQPLSKHYGVVKKAPTSDHVGLADSNPLARDLLATPNLARPLGMTSKKNVIVKPSLRPQDTQIDLSDKTIEYLQALRDFIEGKRLAIDDKISKSFESAAQDSNNRIAMFAAMSSTQKTYKNRIAHIDLRILELKQAEGSKAAILPMIDMASAETKIIEMLAATAKVKVNVETTSIGTKIASIIPSSKSGVAAKTKVVSAVIVASALAIATYFGSKNKYH